MFKNLCEDCCHIQYDSCCNGYCNCECSNNYKCIVVADKGCLVKDCVDFMLPY